MYVRTYVRTYRHSNSCLGGRKGLEIRIIVVDNERAIEGMALLACQNSLIVRVRGTGTID